MRMLAIVVAALSAACTGKSPAIEMRFIDDVDGSPVAGAKITFCGSSWEGTLTGHGGGSINLFRVEGQTDANGAVRLASQEFHRSPFGLSTNYDHAVLIVEKEGYAPYKILNTGRALGSYEAVASWAYQNAVIRLKRATPGAPQTAKAAGLYLGSCN